MHDPAVVARMTNLAAEPVGGSPTQFADYLKTDVLRWQKVVKDSNMKVQ